MSQRVVRYEGDGPVRRAIYDEEGPAVQVRPEPLPDEAREGGTLVVAYTMTGRDHQRAYRERKQRGVRSD